VSEDIGACRRFPLALAQAAHNTWATARASIVFPSDEKTAQQWCCREAGQSYSGRRQVALQQMVMCERTNRQRNAPMGLAARF
jgi:hypothetical protein